MDRVYPINMEVVFHSTMIDNEFRLVCNCGASFGANDAELVFNHNHSI